MDIQFRHGRTFELLSPLVALQENDALEIAGLGPRVYAWIRVHRDHTVIAQGYIRIVKEACATKPEPGYRAYGMYDKDIVVELSPGNEVPTRFRTMSGPSYSFVEKRDGKLCLV